MFRDPQASLPLNPSGEVGSSREALSNPMVGFLYNLKESQGDSQDSTYDIPSMRNMKSGEPAMETTKNSGIIPTVVPTRKSSAQTK